LPIVKWAGGKRRLVNNIKALFPEKFNNYYEPFVGGGALFFNLKPNNATIVDLNDQLINFYEQVRDNPIDLLESSDTFENTAETYTKIRSWDREAIEHTDLEWAARFLYLNKTAYSGMWRVNKNNQMNVPFAGYKLARLEQKTEKYSTKIELLEASELLKRTNIYCASYESIIPNENDLVYLDPPYASTWTGYTKERFNSFSQEQLADFCFDLDAKGVYFILSNNHTTNILEYYEGMNIVSVKSGQSISGRHDKGEKRNKVLEVLITNIY